MSQMTLLIFCHYVLLLFFYGYPTPCWRQRKTITVPNKQTCIFRPHAICLHREMRKVTRAFTQTGFRAATRRLRFSTFSSIGRQAGSEVNTIFWRNTGVVLSCLTFTLIFDFRAVVEKHFLVKAEINPNFKLSIKFFIFNRKRWMTVHGSFHRTRDLKQSRNRRIHMQVTRNH